MALKKLEITFPLIASLFFASYFSIELSMLLFISSSNFLAINPMVCIHMFFECDYAITFGIR
jgi:hypothetical protein